MRKMKDKIPDLMNKGGRKFSQNGILVTTSNKNYHSFEPEFDFQCV